jgi:expansin (peptidoglycan-binding protein)
MIKTEILEALPKLNAEERREIRAKRINWMVKRGSITGNLANRKKRQSKRPWTSTIEIQKSALPGRRQKFAFWPDCMPNEFTA